MEKLRHNTTGESTKDSDPQSHQHSYLDSGSSSMNLASVVVNFDNDTDSSHTIVHITSAGGPGFLHLVINAMKNLGFSVSKAKVEYEDGVLREQFWINTGPREGSKIVNDKDIENVKKVLSNAMYEHRERTTCAKRIMPTKLYKRHELSEIESNEYQKRTDLLFRLMDQYLKNDVYSIQKSIVDHVEYTIARSRFRFDDFEAYQVFDIVIYCYICGICCKKNVTECLLAFLL